MTSQTQSPPSRLSVVSNFHRAPPHRAEQQRDQALQNAETLKEAFNDYKASICVKLQSVRLSA